jgi:hypothetical protein
MLQVLNDWLAGGQPSPDAKSNPGSRRNATLRRRPALPAVMMSRNDLGVCRAITPRHYHRHGPYFCSPRGLTIPGLDQPVGTSPPQ